MGKQKKPKISKIKRNNQKKTKLLKQGKLKTRRHKPLKKQPQKSALPLSKTIEEEESDDGNDLMDMVEEDDLNFLKKAISNRSYNLLKHIRLTEVNKDTQNQDTQKKKKVKSGQSIEELYENKLSTIMEKTDGESNRMLLPIKTQAGFVKKQVIEKNKKT